MPKKQRNYEEELANIMDEIAESVGTMSDQEILDDDQEEGVNSEKAAEATRSLLLDAVKTYEQRHLREAQKRYELRVSAMQEKKYNLPSTPAGRQKLLAAILSQQPEMKKTLLTAQHRDFTSLTDADIESCLKHLYELGVLNKIKPSGDTDK